MTNVERLRLNPWKLFALSWITIGFYALWWYWRLNKAMRDEFGMDVNPLKSLLAVSLGALIVVPGVISAYRTAERVRGVEERFGVDRVIKPWLAFLLSGTGFYGLYVQTHVNRVLDAPPHSFAVG